MERRQGVTKSTRAFAMGQESKLWFSCIKGPRNEFIRREKGGNPLTNLTIVRWRIKASLGRATWIPKVKRFLREQKRAAWGGATEPSYAWALKSRGENGGSLSMKTASSKISINKLRRSFRGKGKGNCSARRKN